MKAELEVILEGNLRLPVSGKADTLADVSKLGAKLMVLARSVKRTFPDLVALPVKAIRIKTTGE